MITNNTIIIDKEKCTGCGICVEECPPEVLEIVDNKSQLINPGFCISCGHCAMVCPEMAIKSSETNKLPFEVFELDGEGEVPNLLKGKRSARVFKDEKISQVELQKIIEYGEMAPSAQNKRDRKYIVLCTAKEVDECIQTVVEAYKPILKLLSPFVLKLISFFSKKQASDLTHLKMGVGKVIQKTEGGKDRIFRGAKCVVLVAGPTNDLFSRDDCIASQHYMMLYAQSIGISSFIAGYAQWAHKKLEKKFKLEKGYSIYAISAFGYNKFKYKRTVRFKPEVDWR